MDRDSEELKDFVNDLHQDVLREAEVDGEEQLRPHAFTRIMIEDMTEAGALDDAQPCYYRSYGLEVSGYGFADDGATLDLLVTRYREENPPNNLGRTEMDTAFRRLSTFLERALDGHYRNLEEASPPFDMALGIHQASSQLATVRFFMLTDGISRVKTLPDDRVRDLEVSYHVWDARRLYRYRSSGQQHEPIQIDFEEEFGKKIPCLTVPEAHDGHTSYVTILPGTVLEALYARYGPRLLELNVRSFLQARGKVNRGIRNTIREQPERFLAYNNGISATAREIEIQRDPEGGTVIASLGDLQIVNGGQTTASLHHAASRDRADISRVFVQAKITVVDQDDVNDMVPLVSRYANSQNAVNEADFSANDPFHVRLEELSRTVWAPPADGTQRQTRWFYERARGQYNDAISRRSTRAQARNFRQDHPNSQKFTKTDLAKFENTWAQLPHLVSLGAQKNFQEFTLRLVNRGKMVPDQVYFQRLVARAILFRRTEKLVSAQQFGGYRANIVAYTLAYLAHVTSSRVDLDRIWVKQDMEEGLAEAITTICHEVHGSITNPPSGRNVTEWCKKRECWDRIRQLRVNLGDRFWKGNFLLAKSQKEAPEPGEPEQSPEALRRIGMTSEVPVETWFDISSWAKETDNLAPWQRSLAYSLGRLGGQGRPPSQKQAKQGLILLEEARRLGFRENGVRDAPARE